MCYKKSKKRKEKENYIDINMQKNVLSEQNLLTLESNNDTEFQTFISNDHNKILADIKIL